MSRRTKIELLGFGEQVELWLQEGKDERWIAREITERTKAKISRASIGNFSRKIAKLAKSSQEELAKRIRIGSVKEAVHYIQKSLEYIESKTELSRGEEALLRQKGDWVDRLLRLQGLARPDSQVNVAVGIDLSKSEFLKRIWETIKPEEAQVRAGVEDGMKGATPKEPFGADKLTGAKNLMAISDHVRNELRRDGKRPDSWIGRDAILAFQLPESSVPDVEAFVASMRKRMAE